MANWTSFRLRITGPSDDLGEIQRMLARYRQRAAEPAMGLILDCMVFDDLIEQLPERHRPWTGEDWHRWKFEGRAVAEDIVLFSRLKNRNWFWSPEECCSLQQDGLKLYGEMKWTPPLAIVGVFAEMFANSTFDIVSTTEYGWHEHWRASGGKQPIQIENLVRDESQEKIVCHWLLKGESTVFHT